MLRNRVWLAAVVAGALVAGGQPAVWAQDTSGIKAADRQRDELFRRRAADIERMPETTPEQRQAKLTAINQLMSDWESAKRQTAGMIGEVERAAAETREAEARSNYYNSNGQPSFMSKLADTALNIGGQVIGSLLQKWLNGGLSNEERSTLDRLMAERDAATTAGAGNPDNPLGRPIYDSNGNIVGWDRDGDSKPDLSDTDKDGQPDSWNGGSYTDAYDYADPATMASAPGSSTATPTEPAASPNGRVSMGSNANDVGGGGDSAEDAEGEGDEEGKDGKEGEEGKEGEDAEGKDGKGAKAEAGKDGKRPTTGGATNAELATTHGRIMVLPKPDPLAAPGGLTGDVRPGAKPGPGGAARPAPGAPGAKKDDWESWGDEWPDNEDNGDYNEDWSEDWGDDWGKKPTTGGAPGRQPAGKPPARTQPGQPVQPGQPGQPALPGARPGTTAPAGDPRLLDDLIRVEATIASWRKVEKEKQLREKDPYAFGNEGTKLQGNYGQTTTEDPFKAYRTLDGRLDLTKVDVWLVAEDSWLEGKEPRRYRLRVTEESVDTFDPIHEGYMVVRGTILDLPVDPNVMAEIKGEVKEMEVAQVVVSSKEPPAADGTVEPDPKNPNSGF